MTKETSMSSIQERVAKGAAWLDEVRPGWRDAINLDTLDICDGHHCVCGQVFAADALSALGKQDYRPSGFYYIASGFAGYVNAVAHGFMWSLGTDDARDTEACALTAEWRRVIHQSLPVADHAPTRETSNV